MNFKTALLDKTTYVQIAIGLFANLLALYSIYQINSVEYHSQNFGIISFSCFSAYLYQWFVEVSWMLALMNSVFLSFGVWWQRKIDVKQLVLLLIPAEIYFLDLALCAI